VRQGDVAIRPARSGDATAIGDILRAAFDTDAEARLVDALHDDRDAVIALVAEETGQVVGMVLLSMLEAPAGALALAPVAVHPDCQGTGIGTALVRAAIAAARDRGSSAIFLLGEPGYYERFGFSVAAARPFDSPYPPEYMMALPLRPYDPGLHGGSIIYPAAFAGL